MKTDDFKPFDDVADSMQAAASRLGIPIEAVKQAKREGSDAFRGSRVHVGKLVKELKSQKELGVADILEAMLEQALAITAEKNIPVRDAENILSAVQIGFGAAVLILEPAKADHFLSRTAKRCEQTFKPIRKNCRNGSKASKGKANDDGH
jgi:hypothetical protein